MNIKLESMYIVHLLKVAPTNHVELNFTFHYLNIGKNEIVFECSITDSFNNYTFGSPSPSNFMFIFATHGSVKT